MFSCKRAYTEARDEARELVRVRGTSALLMTFMAEGQPLQMGSTRISRASRVKLKTLAKLNVKLQNTVQESTDEIDYVHTIGVSRSHIVSPPALIQISL